MHTNRSQSRGKSHVSHAENEKDMQHEINELKKHHLNLSLPLGIQRMIHIGKDLKLRLVKPSPVMKNTVIIGGRAKVLCIRA